MTFDVRMYKTIRRPAIDIAKNVRVRFGYPCGPYEDHTHVTQYTQGLVRAPRLTLMANVEGPTWTIKVD